jgi:dual specificity phosphatase 12
MKMAKPTVYRIIVVGKNRPRLSKILSILEEQEDDDKDLSFSIDLVPCLARIDSYESEDGKQVRYLSNFVRHDGVSMAEVFDDADMLIQQPLSGVAMVGYEWAEDDVIHIDNYFKANNHPLEVECVQPEEDYGTLHGEMEAFKNFTPEQKEKCFANRTMGPGKMVRFILDFIDHVRENINSTLNPEPGSTDDTDSDEPDESQVVERRPPNPNLPRFACRICRTILFGEEDLETNHVQNLHNFKRGNFQQTRQTVACQSIFLKDSVLEFLAPQGQDTEGKLSCTKCSAKLGHWKWAGAQCSCGTWVTPAIQIPSSKVDVLQPQTAATPIAGTIAPSVIAAGMM